VRSLSENEERGERLFMLKEGSGSSSENQKREGHASEREKTKGKMANVKEKKRKQMGHMKAGIAANL